MPDEENTDFQQARDRTPVNLGHLQLVISDGRISDRDGNIIEGDNTNIGASSHVFPVNAAGKNTGEKARANDVRSLLSPASQQKILDVINELRTYAGPKVLPDPNA